MELVAALNFRIMTGNKNLVRIVIYALILCLLLAGCFGKTDSYEDDETGNETVSNAVSDPTGTTAAVIDEEETESDTKPLDNTISDDKFTIGDSVPDTESPEKPTHSSTSFIPAKGNDDTLATEQTTTPTENTTTPTPGSHGSDMPGYGIELPYDNWD